MPAVKQVNEEQFLRRQLEVNRRWRGDESPVIVSGMSRVHNAIVIIQ